MVPASPSTVDAEEVARFAALAGTWWDPEGPMRPLHRLNPMARSRSLAVFRGRTRCRPR